MGGGGAERTSGNRRDVEGVTTEAAIAAISRLCHLSQAHLPPAQRAAATEYLVRSRPASRSQCMVRSANMLKQGSA